MKNNMNRRDLLKTTFMGSAVLASGGLAACTKSDKKEVKTEEAPSAGGSGAQEKTDVTFLKESNSMAQSLGYKEDASSVDSAVRVDKGKTKGNEQFCNNCQFYTADGDDKGKCSLFPGKYVKAKGWCKSWQLKA